jgi:hypothetical protein
MELREFKRAGGDAGAPALATAKLVFTTGAAVLRYDWMRERRFYEKLEVSEDAVNLSRLQRGAPLLNTHSAWDLEDQLGVVEDPEIVDGQGTCGVTFSRRESVAGFVQDVADRVIRNVSVGYSRDAMQMEPPEDDTGIWTYRVMRWTPYEVSLVPIPADMDSQVRSGGESETDPAGAAFMRRTFPCQITELADPQQLSARAAAQSTKETTMTEAELEAKRQREEAEARDRDAAAQRAQVEKQANDAATARAAEITDLCGRSGVSQLAVELIRSGASVDQACRKIVEERARQDAAAGGHTNTRVEKTGDEQATRMAGIEESFMHRLDPRVKLTDNGRQFRGMSLLEVGRDYLEGCGVSTRGLDRMTLATRMLTHRSNGMLATSDLSNILANVATKRLRNGYDENPGTYSRWARRAPNAPDFKQMSVVQMSAMPDLLQVNEHGEFKYGSISDGAEKYQLLTYGRIVSLSRQSVVNDDLRAFDRLVSGFGASAARLENRTVYAQLTANANLSDGNGLFSAAHANNATGGGSVLAMSALTEMRRAMRVQKGLQNEELNITPIGIIVPAALEQLAYQLTSSNYVPAKATDVNEFRQGGRTSLDPVVEPILDGVSATAWYGFANYSQVDTVEFCWLDGAEGPVVESEIGFEVDGISFKCREDFAAKALDWRGLYRAVGA